MKRRVLSLLLCALLLAGLAFGCANKNAKPSPKDSFFEIADGIGKLEEIGFDASLSMNIPKDSGKGYTSFLGDISDANLLISGSSSKFFKQFACEIVATVRGSQGESTLKVTDILCDESGMYLNLRSLFNVISIVMGLGGPYDALFSSDYLRINPEELSSFAGVPLTNWPGTDKENMPKRLELNEHMLKVIKDSLKDEYFKEEGGVYTLSLNSPAASEILKAFLSDVDANAGLYADALLETDALVPGYLAALGLDKESPSRDDVIAFVKEKAAELSEDAAKDEGGDTSSLLVSLSKGKAEKSYDIRVSLTDSGDNIDIRADISLAEVATEKKIPPKNYVKLEDFFSVFLM